MRSISYSAFLKRIKDTIKQYDMLSKSDRVLVAVSGGADSVCLMKSLLAASNSLGITVVIGNIDHSLRGADSEKDSIFVKSLAKKLGVKCLHKKIDVRQEGKKGTSLEEKAREKRYSALVEFAEKEGCNIIATGHTADDQAETVLLKIIYGSSISGITGIPPVRQHGKIKIIRPLIRTEKKDILDFLKKNNLKFVEDSSNKDTRILRNNIRLRVLPYLEKLNPRIKRSLVNLSDTLREDLSFIEKEKEKMFKKTDQRTKNEIKVKTRDLLLQPKTMRKEVLKELFKRAGGNVKKLTYRHWMDMDKFLKNAPKGKSLDLPGGVQILKKEIDIVFTKPGCGKGRS